MMSFLHRFGARNRKDAIGEYLSLYKHYQRKSYKRGLGKYLFSRMRRAMSEKHGIVAVVIRSYHDMFPMDKRAMDETEWILLKHRDLGLKSLPVMFKKLALTSKGYHQFLRIANKANGATLRALKVEKAGGLKVTKKRAKKTMKMINKITKKFKVRLGGKRFVRAYAKKSLRHARRHRKEDEELVQGWGDADADRPYNPFPCKAWEGTSAHAECLRKNRRSDE